MKKRTTKQIVYIVSSTILLAILLTMGIIKYNIYTKIFPNYEGWKKIEIANLGYCYIPNNWIYTKKDDIVYFTDKPLTEKEYKIYLIGTEHVFGEKYTKITDVFEESEEIETRDLKLLSNGATYSEKVFKIRGEEKNILHIEFHKGTQIFLDLYAWDNLVDINTIKKIAESYISES